MARPAVGAAASNMTQLGILWDLDGTLIDTGEFHYQAWAHTLAAHHLAYNRDTFHATFGMNNFQTLTFIMGQPPAAEFLEQINQAKETRFRTAIHGQAQPLPGVIDWLKRLQLGGTKQAIASSAPIANIDVLVDELNIRSYFDKLVAGADLPSKPDPAIFLAAASQLGLSPDRCVVVEDSVAGVAGAKRAGMRCVAVTNTNPAEALQEADVIVDRLDALPPTLFHNLVN